MELTLKSLKLNAALSEETNCYSATLYCDGKKVALVSNRGKGACDDQHWLDADAKARITAAFAALPEEPLGIPETEGMMVQPDLEHWCATEIANLEVLNKIARSAKRKTLLVAGGQLWELAFDPTRLDQPHPQGGTFKDQIAAMHPDKQIVSGLDKTKMRAALVSAGLCREIDLSPPASLRAAN